MGGSWPVDLAAYDRLLTLPGAGWAWEFMRRNPALKKARRSESAVRARISRRTDGSVVCRLGQRCHIAESFGLHFIPDPACCAFEAELFWLPDVMSASFDAMAEFNSTPANTPQRFSWDKLPGEKLFLIAPGRRDKLVIRAPGYAAQLALDGAGALIAQSVSITLRVGADRLEMKSLQQLEEFGRACGGLAPRRKPLRGARPEKLRDALIALDGELSGIPRKRIGEAIFGSARVRGGWDDSNESYKKRTKRLVEKGLGLMSSHYRKLL